MKTLLLSILGLLTIPTLGGPIHTNPLAYAKVYLDPTAWTATDEQKQQTVDVIASAFSPWADQVDITTEDPGDRLYVAWLKMGGAKPGVAGEAGIGNWYFGTMYRAFSDIFAGHVYADSLNNDPTLTGKTAVHETGHLLGLKHQSDWVGTSLLSEYSNGDATTVPWMGNVLVQSGKTPVFQVGLNVDHELQNDAGIITHDFASIPEPACLWVFGLAMCLKRRTR